MILFRSLWAQWCWLRGLKHYYRGNQDEAVRLLERACALDAREADKLHYSVLGRSYLALNRTHEAVTALARAYELFKADDRSRWRDFEREQFVLTLKTFANALHRRGQFERAKEVAREVTEYTAAAQTTT